METGADDSTRAGERGLAARACNRLRRISHAVYGLALLALGIGALFAFVLPRVAG